jgi:hypothetical protein
VRGPSACQYAVADDREDRGVRPTLHWMALASFLLGLPLPIAIGVAVRAASALWSLPLLWVTHWVDLLLPPVALLLGVVGLRRIRRQPEAYRGAGLAVAGIVLSGVVVLSWLLAVFALPVGAGPSPR